MAINDSGIEVPAGSIATFKTQKGKSIEVAFIAGKLRVKVPEGNESNFEEISREAKLVTINIGE